MTVPNGQTIAVHVITFSFHDVLWFEFRTQVGPTSYVGPALTLSRNVGLATANAFIEGQNLGLRLVLPVDELSPDDLDDALASIAMLTVEAADSDRVREGDGTRNRNTPWTDWPKPLD